MADDNHATRPGGAARPVIRVLTDGHAGNRAQALGLADALSARSGVPVEEAEVALSPALRLLPQRLLAGLGARALAGGTGVADCPLVAIGAGRRGNLAAAILGRRGAWSVAILDPQLPLSRFDTVVAPEHDGLSGANVIPVLGSLNRLTGARVTAPAPVPDLPAPRLAVLVGGPSRSAVFDRASLDRLIADLGRFAGWSLLVTPSRRTPDWVLPALRTAFPDAWIWDGDGENPYPALLGATDAVLVTEDSVNMVSEAAFTGHPVHVSGTGRVAAKFRRFHARLAERGITRPAAEGPGSWHYPPLDETARVAELLMARPGFPLAGRRPI